MHIEIIDPMFSFLSGVICIGLPMTYSNEPKSVIILN